MEYRQLDPQQYIFPENAFMYGPTVYKTVAILVSMIRQHCVD